ncbi:MAG TPA: hypothetical protein VNF99_07030 [Stellaceae bacterium]|nr:hypothetical protein [Stellaceae bacterium]
MAERPEDVNYLRGLAARLRSLALTEPRVADQLQKMADEAEERASAIEATLTQQQPKMP